MSRLVTVCLKFVCGLLIIQQLQYSSGIWRQIEDDRFVVGAAGEMGVDLFNSSGVNATSTLIRLAMPDQHDEKMLSPPSQSPIPDGPANISSTVLALNQSPRPDRSIASLSSPVIGEPLASRNYDIEAVNRNKNGSIRIHQNNAKIFESNEAIQALLNATVASSGAEISMNTNIAPEQSTPQQPMSFATKSNNIIPGVCIVVTTYNVVDYVKQAIDSILAQTHKNLQIVVVDDCSNDGTPEKVVQLFEFRGRDSINQERLMVDLIKLPHNTLGGTGQPSNIGMSACNNDMAYLMFLDGDDFMEHDTVESLVSNADSYGSDIVVADFNTVRYDENGRPKSLPSYSRGYFLQLPSNQTFNAASHPAILEIPPVPWTKLYRRSFLEMNNIQFLEGDYFFEDNAFHWKNMIHAKSITKIEKVFFHHRVGRVGQTTSNLLQKDSGDENALSLEKIRTISKGAKLGGILPNFHHIGHYLFAESNSLSVERSWQDLKTASHIARLYFGKLKGQAPVLISKQYSVAMQSKFARRLAQISNYWFQNANATYVKEVEPRLRMFGHKFQNLDLSIIIPTFNDGSEICELLDNLYAHLPDPGFSFEVFVVDDGSTDNATINSLLDFAAKQKSNFYFLSSATTFGAGRARNMAIPLVEGQYVYFAEATDDYNFGTLRNAVKHVQQNNIDLLVLSYFVEQLNSDKSTTRVGMMHQDANIWTEIEKTGNNMTQAEKRNAALALLNYPWKQITRSDVMFNANAYFGPTIVHNDAQFHWTSIWASQNIAFYPRKEKVCTHKKVDQSLSGVRSKKRTGMDVFPAIHSTQRALSLLGAFEPSTEEESVVGKREASSEVFDLWKQFSRSLLSIYSKQVPPELLSKFSSKENMLLDGLDSVSTISHMDPLPYWVVENVLGNNHSDEDNAPS